MNRLFHHSGIVLFALCLAVVSYLVPDLDAAEQPDAAQRYYERGTALLRKGDLAAASEAAPNRIKAEYYPPKNPAHQPIYDMLRE